MRTHAEFIKYMEEYMTERTMLRRFGWNKGDMTKILRKTGFRQGLKKIEAEGLNCKSLLEACHDIMDRLSPEPEGGWLNFLYADGKHALYAINFPDVMEPCYELGKTFYMEMFRLCTEREMEVHGFCPTLHFAWADVEERKDCGAREEYETFLDFCHRTYFPEFMRLAAELTPFNTLGHIAGVHHVAMVMARQLKAKGSPVDLALMSAAAIGHDIGKFGCKDKESRRVPYLHYYYTDLCLTQNGMPQISYIAANHSTWDLELENLSLESLLLIYADFRVKSTRTNGVENIHFYSLQDSFDVILGKLDNVDEAKRHRYCKVYSKLVDFEDYMHMLGVQTDLSEDEYPAQPWVDSALLQGDAVIREFKNTAIRHNIQLMHILNHESSFTDILESARSEKDWKNTRTYLNIFREYSTYMNQRQKRMTIEFLYELMMHHESDIRNEATELMGRLIANYDIEYRKEIPEGMSNLFQHHTCVELLNENIQKLLVPDHKLTEQHRKWLSYKFESLCCSVLSNCKPAHKDLYMDAIYRCYLDVNRDEFTAFCMVNALRAIPLNNYSMDQMETFLQFALHFAKGGDEEIQTAILDYVRLLVEHFPDSDIVYSYVLQFLDLIPEKKMLSITYLRYKIMHLVGISRLESWDKEVIRQKLSEVFLENLKSATPWICKVINIDFLLDQFRLELNDQPVHTITHLVNLLTGAECSDVRQRAGRTMLAMAGDILHESRNEVAIELLQSLELSENEFAKSIPYYLGRLILMLEEQEVDEIIGILEHMLVTENDQVACVTLDTIGVMLQGYPAYRKNHEPEKEVHEDRIHRMLGILLRGMAWEHEEVSREAFYVLGDYLFGHNDLTLKEQYSYFHYLAKKSLHILKEQKENYLGFLINAAAMNHIYRFISEYTLEEEAIVLETPDKVAFFPGTFDPFSLSHKGIVEEIRKMGFEVYLAIDEFSWSKKTQPRLIRRKIVGMSTAEDPGVFLFPDHIPVNIANPKDLKVLKELFGERSVYIVAGSDVTANASAYKKAVEENSIHNFNHIIFRRRGNDYDAVHDGRRDTARILGEVRELSLDMHLEDISSTRIRDNIDLNRDITNLIDPMVQRYIYENNLYLREPQYKPVLHSHPISSEILTEISGATYEELKKTLWREKTKKGEVIFDNLNQKDMIFILLRDQEHNGVPVALAAAKAIQGTDLLDEFGSSAMTRRIRNNVKGRMVMIKAIYGSRRYEYYDMHQLVLTELLAYYLREEYTYCLYHGQAFMEERREKVEATLRRQGFISLPASDPEEMVMVAAMHRPFVLTKNMETVIKAPFNTNENVRQVMDETHRKLQEAIAEFDPGTLCISFDSAVMYDRMMEKITTINQVPNEETKPRQLGALMCVPFGKMLRGSVAPNTVTKTLHTEKVFQPDMRSFTIEEYPGYSPIETQLNTIHSFNRDVILVDDLMHKGYRLKNLSDKITGSGVKVYEILTGIMTANGQDLIQESGYTADSVYFLPNMRSWFTESTLYPFIGGDSVRSSSPNAAGLLTSVNLILPYVMPTFLSKDDIGAVYNLSRVCLENARDILRVLEAEYQKTFQRNLTLDRLNEVILSPTCPDKGSFMEYNLNLPASVYVENDLMRLIRMKPITGEWRN